MQPSRTTRCRSGINTRERRASSARLSPRFGRRQGDDQPGGPFWARDSIYGPERTGQPRKHWVFGAGRRDFDADVSPVNTPFWTPKVTQLKIVVSRVQVPVSPPKIPVNRHFARAQIDPTSMPRSNASSMIAVASGLSGGQCCSITASSCRSSLTVVPRSRQTAPPPAQ
jgi:hypothetical protein